MRAATSSGRLFRGGKGSCACAARQGRHAVHEKAKSRPAESEAGNACTLQLRPGCQQCRRDARYRRAPVSYTHLRAHETPEHLVCRLLLRDHETPEHLVCRLLLQKNKTPEHLVCLLLL